MLASNLVKATLDPSGEELKRQSPSPPCGRVMRRRSLLSRNTWKIAYGPSASWPRTRIAFRSAPQRTQVAVPVPATLRSRAARFGHNEDALASSEEGDLAAV